MPAPKEHRQPTPEGFRFTEHEQIFSHVTHARFRELVFDPQTTIHRARVDCNTYGEFVFITASRLKGEGREVYTFWGLGLHEYRDRWLMDTWFYHRANQYPAEMKLQMEQAEVEELLRERQAEIVPYAEEHRQSRHGQMFEDLAELTDDDGTLADLEDLEGLMGAFFDDLE